MNRRVYDQLMNANLSEVCTKMYAVVDRIQLVAPGEQIAATCILFRLLCERYGMNPQDAFTATGNMISRATEGRRVQLDAARRYLKEELTDV